MIYSDNKFYCGKLVNGILHGYGILYHNNGDWVNSKPHGKGKYIYFKPNKAKIKKEAINIWTS